MTSSSSSAGLTAEALIKAVRELKVNYLQELRLFHAGPSLCRALQLEGVQRVQGATIICGPGEPVDDVVEAWREIIRAQIPADHPDRQPNALEPFAERRIRLAVG